AEAGVPVVAVVGEVVDDPAVLGRPGLRVVSLVERFGDERARGDVLACVEEAVAEALAGHRPE
ncbi:MAG: hypothetical protein FWJ72_16810, partial [Acidimicrobiia bacterium]